MDKNNEEKPIQSSLHKVLDVPAGIAILIGITIGAGIYSTPQIIAGYQSSFSGIMTLWLGVGAFVFVGGLIYAELGTRMPRTGGEYVYISRCFGPFAGFMFGWAQLFIIRTSAAAGLSIITINYLGYFIKMSAMTQTMLSLLVIAFLGTINYIGIQHASIFQQISTLLKVGGLFVLVATGLILIGDTENMINTNAQPLQKLQPVANTVAAIILIVFTHMGWDRIGYSAGEMKNPRKTIPISLFVGLAVIIILYLSANFIYYRTLGIEGLRNSTIVASDTAIMLIGPIGAGFTAVLVMISAIGSINGTMMTAPRVYYAMAKDGLFFNWLNYVHPKFRTPSRAIIAHCIWGAAILLIRGQFETIVAGMVFAVLIFYALTTIALFKLRKADDGSEDIYRMPFYPILPAIYLLGILSLLIFRGFYEWENSLMDLAFIATGLPFALYWVRKSKG